MYFIASYIHEVLGLDADFCGFLSPFHQVVAAVECRSDRSLILKTALKARVRSIWFSM